MPSLGIMTKDEVKAESKLYRDIATDPTLAKFWGIRDKIRSHQELRLRVTPLNPNPVDFITMNDVVPTSVKNLLEANPFKYVVTSVVTPAPPGMPYVTTWVRITKISWEV